MKEKLLITTLHELLLHVISRGNTDNTTFYFYQLHITKKLHKKEDFLWRSGIRVPCPSHQHFGSVPPVDLPGPHEQQQAPTFSPSTITHPPRLRRLHQLFSPVIFFSFVVSSSTRYNYGVFFFSLIIFFFYLGDGNAGRY